MTICLSRSRSSFSHVSLPSLHVYPSPIVEINNEINDNRPENCFGFCSATILLSRHAVFFFSLVCSRFSFLLSGSTRGKRDSSDHPARNLLDIYCASLSLSLSISQNRKGGLFRPVTSRTMFASSLSCLLLYR